MQPGGPADAEPQPDELLRRDRAGRVPHRQPGAGHRGHERPADAGAAVLLPRHAADPARRAELHPAPDQLPARRRSNDMLRDGMHQTVGPRGVAPYLPNSLDGGRPLVAAAKRRRVRARAAAVDGREGAGEPGRPSPTTTPRRRMFCVSLTPVEQLHVVEAFTFELGKCYEPAIRERMLGSLANVDAGPVRARRGRARSAGAEADREPADVTPSPALSQIAASPGRSPAGWSASSPVPAPIWPGSPSSARRSRRRAPCCG